MAKIGRPKEHEEPMQSVRYDLPIRVVEKLKERKAKTRVPVVDQVRDALISHVEETMPRVTLRKISTAAPCGPFAEVAPDLESFQISGELAELLGLLDDDLVVPCKGESMVGADIMDGAVLVMRPLEGTAPRDGEIVLAQVICDNNECFWTVKRWFDNGGRVMLKNGDHEELGFPSNAIELKAIARRVATLTPEK